MTYTDHLVGIEITCDQCEEKFRFSVGSNSPEISQVIYDAGWFHGGDGEHVCPWCMAVEGNCVSPVLAMLREDRAERARSRRRPRGEEGAEAPGECGPEWGSFGPVPKDLLEVLKGGW